MPRGSSKGKGDGKEQKPKPKEQKPNPRWGHTKKDDAARRERGAQANKNFRRNLNRNLNEQWMCSKCENTGSGVPGLCEKGGLCTPKAV